MIDISVIIPSYNRKAFLERCINSVFENGIEGKNIIVVDDASTDGTDSFIPDKYPNVSYHRFNENKGVCCARNYGLNICNTEYALFLDSDDQLCTNALIIVDQFINEINKENTQFSVFYFLRDKTTLLENNIKFLLPENIINACILGNTTEVVNTARFKERGYTFPEHLSAIGAEHILWLEVAMKEGIPFKDKVITIENDDAENRLTSVKSQIMKAKYHALSQEETIKKFGDLYYKYNKNQYFNRLFACSVYYKLSGNFYNSLEWAFLSIKEAKSIKSMIPLIFSLLPLRLARLVFIKIRSSKSYFK